MVRFHKEDTLLWNLKRWGAPLADEGRSPKKLSLEETLGSGLVLARRRPNVARVWPIVFAKNRDELNLDVLAQVARRFHQKRALGFFLSLMQKLLKDARLAKAERQLREKRSLKTVDFFVIRRGRRARALAAKRTPALARKWGFRMNMPLDSFVAIFRKFMDDERHG
jgi:hypothetical protein